MQIFQTVNSVRNIKDLHKQVEKIRYFEFVAKTLNFFVKWWKV